MSAPRWSAALLRRLAPAECVEDVLGDLDEVHARRVARRGRAVAGLLTGLETLDMALALARSRARRGRHRPSSDGAPISWLDFKLGFRMLVKYPVLTLVGALAMAFAIWMGAATFELVTQVVTPSLPLADGDRVVGLRLWDAERSRPERRVAHDFGTWRAQLRTVQELGAFRQVERNLVTDDGRGEPVTAVEISAVAFRVTRVPPLLGRALVDADELPGAPSVAVIGHALWQARFGGDPRVVGRTVRLGGARSTVVGVMPEGYAFPVAHELWVPLRVTPSAHEPREGPGLQLFGRLAPGASLSEAQAELAALGQRTAAASPETHEHLRPQVMPYARSIVDVNGWMTVGVLSSNLVLVMFLVLVCGNVSLLLFARAATREGEIIVRTALGASRRRIVMQLFAEALVLGGVAAVVGLSLAGFGLRWVMGIVEGEILDGAQLPFWFHAHLSATTVLYAIALTVLGAVISGVLPALKVTRAVGTQLRHVGAGGGGLRFGGVWTVVIVSQVAVTVAFPAVTYFTRRDAEKVREVDVGFASHEYLTMRVEMDREPPPGMPADTSAAAFRERYRASYVELRRRLLAEPGVVGVTAADRMPRMYHPARRIEVDDGGAAPYHRDFPDGYRVSSADVEPGFFDALRVPIVAGRGFRESDHEAGRPVVVVNQSFVDRVLGGRNPIGRRLQYEHYEEWDAPRADGAPPLPWHEIVGVVRDMGGTGGWDPKVARVYHPVAPGATYPAQVAVHVRGEPAAFASRLRAVAAGADPTLRLYDVMPLDQVNAPAVAFMVFWFRLVLAASAVALTLSLAGIYAVMSFTVARRTREIGIRVALGADRRRVVTSIFRRPLWQVSIGVASGGLLLAALMLAMQGGTVSALEVAALGAYVLLMFGVCMLACIVPTRRALRVEPTEALRADG